MSTAMQKTKMQDPPEVEIELPDQIPTDAELEEGFKELGMVRVSAKTVRNYARMGVHVSRQGVIQGQRGQAFYNQHIVADTMRQLHEHLCAGLNPEDPKKHPKLSVEDVCNLAREISNASGKLTASQEFALKLTAGTPRPPDVPTSPRSSFPAGAIVAGPGSNVHVHNHGQNQEAKPVAPTEGKK